MDALRVAVDGCCFIISVQVKINDNGPGKDLREGGRCHQSSGSIVAECGQNDCVDVHKKCSQFYRFQQRGMICVPGTVKVESV